jgi:hypothetical protein
MVEAVDLEPAAPGQAVQRRAGVDRDRVGRLVGLVGLAVLERRVVGQVLVQRAAAGDVERLHPTADGEHREVSPAGLA